MLIVHRLPHPLTLDMGGPIRPPPVFARRIDAIWAAACDQRPHLFDGPILSVVAIDGAHLTLAAASYRHVVAARQDPAIARALALRPLAVTGLLVCPDGVVFARRGGGVTQGPGRWELAPSGGLEPGPNGGAPDVAGQILTELAEEIGLTADQATVHPPLGLIENPEGGVIDIVLPITTGLDAPAVVGAHADHLGEYEAVEVAEDPARFCARHQLMLPESLAILEHWSDRIDGLRRFAVAGM